MTKNYLVDTNVFLRYFLQDNEEQYQKAKKWLNKAKKKKFNLVVFPQVIFEINYVLSNVYGLSKKEVADCLKEIIVTPYLEIIDRGVLLSTINEFRKINVDLIDIYLHFQAKDKKAKVLTFDKDFNKL